MADGIGFSISIPKEFFFDRKAVLDAVGKANVRNLAKMGAFIRTRMRSLTGVKSKNSAPPGKPPRRHAGQLHDLIFFASDGQAVTIGPVVFKKGEAPALLEFGGTAKRRVKGKMMTVRYRGNPFALPSLEKEIEAGTVSSVWRDSVKS